MYKAVKGCKECACVRVFLDFGFWDVVSELMRREEEEYEALVYEWHCMYIYLGVK